MRRDWAARSPRSLPGTVSVGNRDRRRLYVLVTAALAIVVAAGIWLAADQSSSAGVPTIDQVYASCAARPPSTAPGLVRGYLFLSLGQTSPPRRRPLLTLGFLWRSRHDRDVRALNSVITLIEHTNRVVRMPAANSLGRIDGDVTVHGQIVCTSPQPSMVIDKVTR